LGSLSGETTTQEKDESTDADASNDAEVVVSKAWDYILRVISLARVSAAIGQYSPK
jgi:hypothetical protein